MTRAERITPRMQRITLGGEDLGSFASPAFDDHVKILVPSTGDGFERRDYTPRRFDAARRELVIDFAVHEGGPATDWALAAWRGTRLSVGGPRGSKLISGRVDRWLLIGDETALPAMGRKIEESGAGVEITLVAAVADAADEQAFVSEANVELHWVHRAAELATDPAALLAATRSLATVPGTFVWIAAEASVARAVRRHFLDERGHPEGWLKTAGYWVEGQADAAVKDMGSA